MASADKVPMLAEGHRKIDDEVRHLKMSNVPRSSKQSRWPGRMATWPRNAEYHAAKERQGQVRRPSPTSRTV